MTQLYPIASSGQRGRQEDLIWKLIWQTIRVGKGGGEGGCRGKINTTIGHVFKYIATKYIAVGD